MVHPEFAANYRAAMESDQKPGKHGTFHALGRSYLRSADFAALASKSQRKRRDMVERFLDKYGDLPVAQLEHRHVRTIMDEYAGKPGTCRNMLSTLRVLIALAIADGIRKDDPTYGIKRPRLSRDGWHCWDEAEIAQFEARHPAGSQAQLALALAVHTGQRAADLVRMGRQHVRDGKISVAQQKTGTRLWVPLHPDLRAIIDATPSNDLTFLITAHGKPYANANCLGNAMNAWAKQAGLTATARSTDYARHVAAVSPRRVTRPRRSWRSAATSRWPRSRTTPRPPTRCAWPRRQ